MKNLFFVYVVLFTTLFNQNAWAWKETVLKDAAGAVLGGETGSCCGPWGIAAGVIAGAILGSVPMAAPGTNPPTEISLSLSKTNPFDKAGNDHNIGLAECIKEKISRTNYDAIIAKVKKLGYSVPDKINTTLLAEVDKKLAAINYKDVGAFNATVFRNFKSERLKSIGVNAILAGNGKENFAELEAIIFSAEEAASKEVDSDEKHILLQFLSILRHSSYFWR